MVDSPHIPDARDYFASNAARKRLRARHRAQWRLKAYGLLAIGLAALALAALLGSVFSKATGALTESYVTLPITLDAAKLDPTGSGDPKTILRADFAGLTKKALKSRFSDIKGRKVKRQLYDLVSGGASFELAAKVAAQPDLLGQTIAFRFLASDITDLYLKGAYGRLERTPPQGRLSVTVDSGTAVLASSAPDFLASMMLIKKGLLTKAATLRRQAARQDVGAREYARRAEAASSEAERARNDALAQSAGRARDGLLAQAADLKQRATQTDGTEVLDRDTPSVLVKAAGGWIKLTQISPTGAQGTVFAPPSAPVHDSADWVILTDRMPEAARKISDHQIVWIEQLREAGAVSTIFNWRFFTASDSREPELAGIRGAAVGSFWTMLVTF